jgi:hypothetical protein
MPGEDDIGSSAMALLPEYTHTTALALLPGVRGDVGLWCSRSGDDIQLSSLCLELGIGDDGDGGDGDEGEKGRPSVFAVYRCRLRLLSGVVARNVDDWSGDALLGRGGITTSF